MSGTARATWLDAWEGASTPSPYSYRGSAQRDRDDRYARQRATARSYRYQEREVARERAPDPREWTAAPRGRGVVRQADWADASERTSSVVRLSAARRARQTGVEAPQQGMRIREVPAIPDYDWEAAARRRPAWDECERVILHADRSIEARMTSTQYYGREATARRPEPWPGATRRETQPRLRVVKHRVPRWRLVLVAGLFALLMVGLMIIAPIMTNSAVAGLESSVGRAENQQQQLAADTAALSSQISSLSSPQRVAEEASQLGLRPANSVSYLSSGDQQMLASEGDKTVAGR